MGEKRNVYRLLVGKPEGKRPLERPRRKWVEIIMVHLIDVTCDGFDWIGLAQDIYRWRASVSVMYVPHLKHLWNSTACCGNSLSFFRIRMQSSGMLRRVAVLRRDVSEEHISSIIVLTRIGEQGTTLAVFFRSLLRLLVTVNVVPSSPVLVSMMMEVIRSSETSVLIRATLRYIPEDVILLSLRRGNLKSYVALTGWTL
jgi:hypothetical protein